MDRSVHVRAPCRLHFGMFSFGQSEERQFGGVGAMVDSPAVDVTFTPAEQLAVRGELADRAERFIALASHKWNVHDLLRCEVTVQSPPDHTGLGVGTQLGLTVAAGLRRFLELPELSIEQLASSVNRGARSAIGSYGFQQGGLLVDAGKARGDKLGKLAHRVTLPEDWRFVLVRSAEATGLTGDHEANAFAQLPPVPPEITAELWRITDDEMLHAIARHDCSAFGDAVFRFGRLAGKCFAPVQGGPFASPATARLVETIRARGIPGVGQSSWGPTVFAIAPDQAEAELLAEWLTHTACVGSDITISAPNNHGAQITLS